MVVDSTNALQSGQSEGIRRTLFQANLTPVVTSKQQFEHGMQPSVDYYQQPRY